MSILKCIFMNTIQREAGLRFPIGHSFYFMQSRKRNTEKFQNKSLNSNQDIDVQKIKVKKMVLNSYFIRNNAYHILKDIFIWTKIKCLSFHI